MATNAKARPRVGEMPISPWVTAPSTMEQRLERIEAMGKRMAAYIHFMSQVPTLSGFSPEAKEKAVTAFYERLAVMETQLARIQEDFQLE